MALLRALLVLSFLIPQGAAARTVAGAGALEFSLSVREPEHLVAFYSARGFPQAAIEHIAATCFITVGILNRSQDVVWLELSEWRFETNGGRSVARITRADWEASWERLGLPLGHRATFGWTQLPERRDLQPDEPVGGNVAVVAPGEAFRLIARFRTGAEGRGKPLEVRVDGLSCPAPSRP